MTWEWPQFVFAGLMVLGLGLDLARDGQPKTGKHSFTVCLIAASLSAWLLYMGGFWTHTP